MQLDEISIESFKYLKKFNTVTQLEDQISYLLINPDMECDDEFRMLVGELIYCTFDFARANTNEKRSISTALYLLFRTLTGKKLPQIEIAVALSNAAIYTAIKYDDFSVWQKVIEKWDSFDTIDLSTNVRGKVPAETSSNRSNISNGMKLYPTLIIEKAIQYYEKMYLQDVVEISKHKSPPLTNLTITEPTLVNWQKMRASIWPLIDIRRLIWNLLSWSGAIVGLVYLTYTVLQDHVIVANIAFVLVTTMTIGFIIAISILCIVYVFVMLTSELD